MGTNIWVLVVKISEKSTFAVLVLCFSFSSTFNKGFKSLDSWAWIFFLPVKKITFLHFIMIFWLLKKSVFSRLLRLENFGFCSQSRIVTCPLFHEKPNKLCKDPYILDLLSCKSWVVHNSFFVLFFIFFPAHEIFHDLMFFYYWNWTKAFLINCSVVFLLMYHMWRFATILVVFEILM